MRLHEHRRLDPVPGRQIGGKFIEQVRDATFSPQMVMRIDDRQIGVEWLLASPRKPRLIGRRVAIATSNFETQYIAPNLILPETVSDLAKRQARSEI